MMEKAALRQARHRRVFATLRETNLTNVAA